MRILKIAAWSIVTLFVLSYATFITIAILRLTAGL